MNKIPLLFGIIAVIFLLNGCQDKEVLPLTTNSDTYDPGTGWTLSWSDEFDDGIFDTDTWDRQVLMDPFNNEWQQYTGDPGTAYEQDGYMILKAEWDGKAHGDNHYTSARVISNPGGGNGNSGSAGKTFQYGKIAARIQLPYGKGIWPAFWMLGDNIDETGGDTAWPGCGEIDILETGAKTDDDGYYGHATLHGTLHYNSTEDNSGNNHSLNGSHTVLPSGKFADNFHVFEIEWDKSKIVWKLDGVQYHSENITADNMSEFQLPYYVIFNIAVGGHFTHAPDATTPFPQFMYIDWIRHYTEKG
ncbi:MAG: hypothetical protein B6D68_00190 [spirochete symbiont of Stewartia floridana]|nr:MAG: hypothetical protein B6D68_00190 [spirochete symbiont of Stewartia floridana]